MTRPDAAALRDQLGEDAAARIDEIEIFDELDSTNSYLMDAMAPPPGQARLALADHQTAGRGRGDKRWQSAPGDSLCLSLAYTFKHPPSMLPPLTLALGVAAAEAIASFGVADLRLKWPNDLLVGDAKLGGILTETQQRDPLTVVAGIGINLDLPPNLSEAIDTDWAGGPTSLAAALNKPPAVADLAARIIDHWLSALDRFEVAGFGAFRGLFEELDWLAGKTLTVDAGNATISGVAAGIDEQGALIIEADGARRSVLSGTIRAVRSGDSA